MDMMTAAPDPATAIAALETALASNTLEVEYDGHKVRYESKAAILSALAYFQRKLVAPAAGQPAPASAHRTTYAQFESE
jgi:hypothetical protein